MKVELGNGYFVDASDGMNWTLMQKVEGLKHPRLCGYHANLTYAMQHALRLKASRDDRVVAVEEVDKYLQRAAEQIMSHVRITFRMSEDMGRVKDLTPADGHSQEILLERL